MENLNKNKAKNNVIDQYKYIGNFIYNPDLLHKLEEKL